MVTKRKGAFLVFLGYNLWLLFYLWIRPVQSDRKFNINCSAVYNVNFEQVVKFKLTHFRLTFHFYSTRKHQKASGYLIQKGNMEVEHWSELGRIRLTFTCSKSTIETLEKKCEICSKLTIKTPERRQLRRSGVFIVNF